MVKKKGCLRSLGFTLRSKLVKVSPNGFTLIEMLVVISILAILASISIVLFYSLQAGGRDAKRKADLEVVRSVLEQYHADFNYYPPSLDLASGGPFVGGSKTYSSKLPADPINTDPNIYIYEASPSSCTTNCASYCLYATMENDSNQSDTTNGRCTGSGNYKVISL